jgi:Fe-S-cluster containining protein
MFSRPTDLVRAAEAAAGDDRLVAAVESLYRSADAVILQRDPPCWQCSRCCRFARHGHALFVTTAELACFLRRTDISRARGPITEECPFLRDAPSRCAARPARPLGCRLYHCHGSAEWWQQEQYNRLHKRLRTVHIAYEIPYFYAEWLGVLRAAAAGFSL